MSQCSGIPLLSSVFCVSTETPRNTSSRLPVKFAKGAVRIDDCGSGGNGGNGYIINCILPGLKKVPTHILIDF